MDTDLPGDLKRDPWRIEGGKLIIEMGATFEDAQRAVDLAEMSGLEVCYAVQSLGGENLAAKAEGGANGPSGDGIIL